MLYALLIVIIVLLCATQAEREQFMVDLDSLTISAFGFAWKVARYTVMAIAAAVAFGLLVWFLSANNDAISSWLSSRPHPLDDNPTFAKWYVYALMTAIYGGFAYAVVKGAVLPLLQSLRSRFQ